jgi:phosphatidate cytidylyltransferase
MSEREPQLATVTPIEKGSRRRWRDLLPRVATAVVGVAILLFTAYTGQFLWALTVTIIATMCGAEFFALTREDRRHVNELFGLLAIAAMPMAAGLWGTSGMLAVLTVLALAALVWQTFFLKTVTIVDTALTVFGTVYCGFTLAYLVLIRALDQGAALVVVLMASVWISDTFAYFFGTAFGRHPLAPHVSPRKSWEGFVAGAAGSVLVWTSAKFLIKTPVPLAWFVLIGVAAGVASLFGDLVESLLKREAGVKDAGKWLPGHGGFLDRFDSMIAVAVVVYWMLVWAGL